jgi:plastocyanin
MKSAQPGAIAMGGAFHCWGQSQRIINMKSFRACGVFAMLAGLLSASPTTAQNQSGDTPPVWLNSRSVEVVMDDFMFTPNTLRFGVNTPYHLRLVNNGGHGHSFDAPEFFAAVRIADDDQSKVSKGEIEVEGGQIVDVKFVSQAAGTYQFHCSHFLHASFGMTGKAVIQ